MAARPSLLLFDEPTSGLDPITATTVDDEIIKSRDIGHATSIVVTHQVRDALSIAAHVAVTDGTAIRIVPAGRTGAAAHFLFLTDGSIAFEGTADELRASREPRITRFIEGAADPPWLRPWLATSEPGREVFPTPREFPHALTRVPRAVRRNA